MSVARALALACLLLAACAAPRGAAPIEHREGSGRGAAPVENRAVAVTNPPVSIDTALPASIASLPREAQSEAIAATAQKREALQQAIAKLASERDAYIEEQVEASGGAADSLDQQIYDAVREQAAPLGLRYEDGPKF